MILTRIFSRAWTSYVEFHTRAPFKHYYLALIGLVTFPGYYFVWTYVFPQPYENLVLRAIGTLLCITYLLRERWPAALQAWYYPFTYISMMLGLPAFFTFMLLMNHANAPWLMSTMAALVFVVLVYDIVNVVLVTLAGSIIGILCFYAVAGYQPLPTAYIATAPIFAFTLAAVMFLAYSERSIAQEKLLAAKLLASNIAHEMRTPLLGIRLDSERLHDEIEMTFHGCNDATAAADKSFTDDQKHSFQAQLAAAARIRDHALGANQVIDILLTNLGQPRPAPDDFKSYSYREVIETAVKRFHFRSGESELITCSGDLDAKFRGSDLLMVHVIFNLIKNALKAIEAKGTGGMQISIRSNKSSTTMIFSDTGIGIPKDLLPCIFMPFVTGGRRMQGTGVGLAFAKYVIDSFGGKISCQSEMDHGTCFIIELPLVREIGERVTRDDHASPDESQAAI